jgi:hypothetical protein
LCGNGKGNRNQHWFLKAIPKKSQNLSSNSSPEYCSKTLLYTIQIMSNTKRIVEWDCLSRTVEATWAEIVSLQISETTPPTFLQVMYVRTRRQKGGP